MASIFLKALALTLVMEGLLPFMAPSAWRDAFIRIIKLADGQIRLYGLASMLLGIIVLMAST